MAKITAYKFVNPGFSSSKNPAVVAARSQTLALNRVGKSVESFSKVINDIESISMLRNKAEQQEIIAERRRQRREKDAAAEEAAELKKEGKEGPKIGGAIKGVAKRALGPLESILAPIGNFFLSIAKILITKEILEYLANPANAKKIATFIDKTKFVFTKIFGWAKGFTENILDGFGQLTDPNGTFASRLGGLGKIMLGIIGLKYLMNPFSLISDILGLVDLLGRRGDRPPRIDASKRVTQEATEQATKRVAKEATEKVVQKTGSELAEQGGKRVTGQILKYGGKNISRATHRLFLKIIGKGGVKGLKKAIGAFKVPLISGILTAALNWMMGESIAKSLMMGIGDFIGTMLGTWAGSALGALGGPAAPITIPLGSFLGAMLGGIAGELIGGYLYDLMMGKANLGDDLKAAGAKVMSSLKSLWNDYIMNGEFWAGAWETFLNIGKDVMSSAWGAMMNMWNFVSGAAANFFNYMMEVSKPWREAVWAAFKKYIMSPLFDIPSLIVDLGKTFADQAVKAWMNSKEFGEKIGEAIQEGLKKVLTPENLLKLAGIFNPLNFDPYLKKVADVAVILKDSFGDAIELVFEKATDIIDAFKIPLEKYIDPAVNAVKKTWEIASNLPGWIYNKGIKPIFDMIGNVWNSGPKIWEYLHRPNTFQELTGQEVPEQEMFLGGVVKNVGNAIKNVVSSPIVKTAASFIPGAAPALAGINMASNIMQGNFSPLGMVSSGLSAISPNMGQLAGSIMTNPMGSIADRFGLGPVYKAITGALGGDYTQAMNIAANEVGISPAAMSSGKKMLSSGGFSAEYAMQTAIEFVPVPLVLDRIVPMPQAVPINTSGDVVQATPSSLTSRMR